MLRNPNSIPESDTVISDPVMEPYFITRSQNNGYTVFQRVVKGENNTEYIKTVSYPSNFSMALKTVAREILNEGGKTYDLKTYVKRWEDVKNSLTSILE
jgi:hypothetical protein|tara:strand:- start:370 stop:666 length:297 start_codon:yes stop_codon:yes gene_type:complete